VHCVWITVAVNKGTLTSKEEKWGGGRGGDEEGLEFRTTKGESDKCVEKLLAHSCVHTLGEEEEERSNAPTSSTYTAIMRSITRARTHTQRHTPLSHTTRRNWPRKRPRSSWQKNLATISGLFPNTPHPQAPKTSSAHPAFAKRDSTRLRRNARERRIRKRSHIPSAVMGDDTDSRDALVRDCV